VKQSVQPCSDEDAGMAFTGTDEALSDMMDYAEATGAPLLWKDDPRLPSPFLLLRVEGAQHVRPAEGLYRAFIEGKFPGVEAQVMEPRDEHLRRLMRGPDAPL
jgi:hypothetical protein